MELRQFKHSHYLGAGESFHLAASVLPAETPAVSHTHDYFEVFLVTEGSCIHQINGAQQKLTVGNLVFIKPLDQHCFQSVGKDLCHIINLSIHPDQIQRCAQQYRQEVGENFFWSSNELPDVYLLTGPNYDSVLGRLRSLDGYRKSQLLLDHTLTLLFTILQTDSEQTVSSMPYWLRQACDKILEPEFFKEGAAGFVKAAGRGHEHVCRSTKKHLGISPSAYVNQIRLDYAARRLSHSEAPISRIASECGIENIGHFYRLFQNRFHATPRQYRLLRTRCVVQPSK